MRHAVVQHDLAPAPPGGRQRDGEHLDPGGVEPAAPDHLGLALRRQPHGGAAQRQPTGSSPPPRAGAAPGIRRPYACQARRASGQSCRAVAAMPRFHQSGAPTGAVEQRDGAQPGDPGLRPVVPELVQQRQVVPGLREPRLQVGGPGQQRARVLVAAVVDQRERLVGGLPPGGDGRCRALPKILTSLPACPLSRSLPGRRLPAPRSRPPGGLAPPECGPFSYRPYVVGQAATTPTSHILPVVSARPRALRPLPSRDGPHPVPPCHPRGHPTMSR